MINSTPMKGLGLSAAAAALLVLSPVASALDVEVSGHVDRMIRAADNGGNLTGQGSDIQHLDNGSDQSRVRMTGRQDVDGGASSSGSGVGGSPGADFNTALNIARRMVWSYGMGKSGYIGDYNTAGVHHHSGANMVSSQIREVLEQDVQDILQSCLKDVKEIL